MFIYCFFNRFHYSIRRGMPLFLFFLSIKFSSVDFPIVYINATPTGDFVAPQKTFVERQICSGVTGFKIYSVEGAGSSKSRSPGQLPLMHCPSVDAKYKVGDIVLPSSFVGSNRKTCVLCVCARAYVYFTFVCR